MRRGAELILSAVVLGCSGNSTGPDGHGVANVFLTPDTLAIAIGDSATIQAQPVNAAGSPVTGASLFWSTSDSTIVAVSQDGTVRAVALGVANIDASTAGVSPSHPARIVVVATPVSAIVIAPSTATLRTGGALQFTDTTKDATGKVLTGRTAAWSSSDTTIATVDQAGLVLAKKQGSATVSVSSGSAHTSASLTVTSAASNAIARIVLTPNQFTVLTQGKQRVTAQALNAAGQTVNGVTFAWTTKSAGTIASVDANGKVTGVSSGNDSVFASAAGVTGGAAVTVTTGQSQVASVIVTPNTATITNGNHSDSHHKPSVQLTATLFDAQGNTLVGPTVVWASQNPDIAVVSSAGVVTPGDGGSQGTATITATSEGVQGTATITVSDGGGNARPNSY